MLTDIRLVAATGGRLTETLIGVISPDNRGGHILDNDGEYAFTIRDADTLDLCYRHGYPTGRVVGCYAVRRPANERPVRRSGLCPCMGGGKRRSVDG
jgi:hypothetical protein